MEKTYLKRFEEEIERLNKAQKEAVETIEGPVVVVAGPGTGKTQILTLRIANILLKTDTTPDNILALTFTDSATNNMRRRLVSIIGSAGYYVTISTFHSFADSIIQNYPEYFPQIIGGKPIDKIRQIEEIEKIIEEGNFKEIKPVGNKFFYLKEILSQIGKLKKDGISPDNYKKFLIKGRRELEEKEDFKNQEGKIKSKYLTEERKLKRSEELKQVYEQYQKKLREKHFYDFEEMILETILALKENKNLLLELQERYQYILIDEHQDTNFAQNQVVDLLGSFYENPNIFVVGDSKQAIYKFQGASLENFLYFKNKYKQAKIINLTENYRSTQNILEGAYSLIEKNGIKEKKLNSNKGEGKKIRTAEFETREEEINFVVKDIENKIKAEINPGEIAIIFRENKEAEDIALKLEKRGIPFQVESDTNILNDKNISKLIMILEAINDFGNEEKLLKMMHLDFLNIEPIDIYKISYLAKENKKPIIFILHNERLLEEGEIKNKEKIIDFGEKISKWKKMSINENFLRFLEKVAKESGFLHSIMSERQYFDSIRKFKNLFEGIKKETNINPNYGLQDFISYLNLIKEHGILIGYRPAKKITAVHLMTAHKAKGLEFTVVYITGAVNGKWGNKRRASFFILPHSDFKEKEGEKNEEERRLFYMAITRAKKEITILSHKITSEDRETNPSQFLGEIAEEFKEEIKENSDEKKSEELLFQKKEEKEKPEEEKEFLREIFKKKGLSATALNNYSECPWKFFYNNLIMIPQPRSVSASFGSAIHRTLKNFFEAKKTRSEVRSDFIIPEFKLQLKREALREKDFERLFQKGEKTLKIYYENYKNVWNYNTKNEVKIKGEFESGEKITGILDKIEIENDFKIVVVDYKTGKPKSRNAIEGKTKDGDENYKRQLVFYKILLEFYPKKYEMLYGVLDFVETNERGKFKKEVFEITNEEVNKLKEEIKKVWKEITEFSFWNTRCKNKKCEFCKLREVMK